MLLEFVLSYTVVLLALVLAIGAINLYYFLDLILQKENREKLYSVWLLTLASIAVHASFHTAEAIFGKNVFIQAVETFSLFIGATAVGILAKNTLSFYTFADTRRRLEMSIQERTSELENTKKQLEASHEELTAAYYELKNLDRMKSEFLSNVSHELRTPLTSIKGVLDIMADEELPKEQGELMAMARQNANRLNALIGNLLYYTRMEYGPEALNKEDVDIGGAIASAVKAMTPTAQDKGIAIETSVESKLKALADKKALHKLLFNLLSNAIKFNRSGGRVTVRGRAVKDGRLEICVEDTGIGIPEEHLDRIFERFYQVDGSTRRKYPGIGLGLSIAKAIVEMHGGRIWVESEVGRGSRFAFEIPGELRGIAQDDDREAAEKSNGEEFQEMLIGLRPPSPRILRLTFSASHDTSREDGHPV